MLLNSSSKSVKSALLVEAAGLESAPCFIGGNGGGLVGSGFACRLLMGENGSSLLATVALLMLANSRPKSSSKAFKDLALST